MKAVLTRTNAEENEADVVLGPKPGPPSHSVHGAPKTGRILERLVVSHRVWRIVPFNFETYPGIRMNVPQGKSNWKVRTARGMFCRPHKVHFDFYYSMYFKLMSDLESAGTLTDTDRQSVFIEKSML